jgi:hypothetical protein
VDHLPRAWTTSGRQADRHKRTIGASSASRNASRRLPAGSSRATQVVLPANFASLKSTLKTVPIMLRRPST